MRKPRALQDHPGFSVRGDWPEIGDGMTTNDELLAEYEEAKTELDRANLEAFMIRRRIRLAEHRVTEAESALKAAGVTSRRVATMPPRGRRVTSLAKQQAVAAEERNQAREAAGLARRGRPRRAA
jgi:hypothetical protein